MAFYVAHVYRLIDCEAVADDPFIDSNPGKPQVALKRPWILLRFFQDFHRDAHQWRALFRNVGWI